MTVEPKIIQLPQNRVDLVFEISEGEETAISNIRFVGNREFSDGRLREVVQTRETAWWRFFNTDDVYDPDRLNFDRELLRRFYLSNGFADFRVTSAVAELTPDKKEFFVTFTVDEGEPYFFGNVDIDVRLKELKKEDIAETVEFETGDVYDASVVDKTIEDLTAAVGGLGFAFVDVRPRVKRDRENKTIDVVYVVNEGPRVFVERINIDGNVRTLDKVIRREFKLVEGDAFNAAKLRRSRKRLQGLGFFEKVDIEKIPGSAPDKAIINTTVEEQSTGAISIGFGFSSTAGALGDFSISESNFLGRGQYVNLGLLIAARQSEIDLSFTEPYFLDREVSAGFDVFHRTQDFQDSSSFDSEETGFRLRSGYKITEDLSQSWSYTFKIEDITSVDSSASSLIQAQEGEETLSQIGHRVTYDKRDNRADPTDGYVAYLNTEVAGLGGSIRHLRNVVSGTRYFPLADQWVVSLRGRAGYIVGLGDDVVLGERFFVGGDDVRGFATSGIGPRDTSTDDSLGGEWMYTGSLSMKFPSGLPEELGVTGRIFTDLGSTGQLSPTNSTTEDTGALRLTIGTGVTWASPFGPVGLDLGFPLLEEDFDETELLRVNFGTRF